MTVNTKGFCVIEQDLTAKEVFDLAGTIQHNLIGLFREENPSWNSLDNDNNMGQVVMPPHCMSLIVTFKYRDHNRMLWVHLDCSHDHDDVVVGKKIILSIGCDGRGDSKVLIPLILKAISPKDAKMYYCADDANDENFVELT